MKITYVRTQFWFNLKAGGSVGHTIGVLNGFRQNNCEVKVISNERFLGIEDFTHEIVEPKINYSVWPGEFLYNFYAQANVRKSILKAKPDFIYHRYTRYTFFVAKLAKALNIPLILEFNSSESWKMKYWQGNKTFFRKNILCNIVKHIERYNLRSASLVVAPSRSLRDDLLKKGILEDSVLVNPNGVDPKKFNPETGESKKCKDLRKKIFSYRLTS